MADEIKDSPPVLSKHTEREELHMPAEHLARETLRLPDFPWEQSQGARRSTAESRFRHLRFHKYSSMTLMRLVHSPEQLLVKNTGCILMKLPWVSRCNSSWRCHPLKAEKEDPNRFLSLALTQHCKRQVEISAEKCC